MYVQFQTYENSIILTWCRVRFKTSAVSLGGRRLYPVSNPPDSSDLRLRVDAMLDDLYIFVSQFVWLYTSRWLIYRLRMKDFFFKVSSLNVSCTELSLSILSQKYHRLPICRCLLEKTILAENSAGHRLTSLLVRSVLLCVCLSSGTFYSHHLVHQLSSVHNPVETTIKLLVECRQPIALIISELQHVEGRNFPRCLKWQHSPEI